MVMCFSGYCSDGYVSLWPHVLVSICPGGCVLVAMYSSAYVLVSICPSGYMS